MNEILLWANLAVLLGLVAFGKLYFPSYLKEKAKNLAKKEDLVEITDKVEAVKNTYASEVELLKESINSRSDALSKKREVYNRFIQSMGLFINGREVTTEQQQTFLDCYAQLWLWAPDSVLIKVNVFIEQQMALASGRAQPQVAIKQTYTECVLALRKDCSMGDAMPKDSYRFVFFGEK
ncbi:MULTISPECIES: hypothetical protein [unclassified Pseudoalteromonas]|uniref:hypothetical protein n=1 Tax=unclassified Pseudoalteromonas TaxID=194690 RepID=UPI001600C210|nr:MULTISPECIES: hypothetical protein [unclassified Pseudoalteromonas]MBB1335768.1 hypothetical protein [Pseudoalteromonas sp. SR41-6]MBB1342629.1 hypothetical protein [Pseudoalteromonas sp. SR45-6]MBB1434941.1 hypothetical protein [Pseudoalteromonas sp. SG43-6]MBB1461054.1 hypothetical protein [Pseudoalteromonas sp. SG41-8]